MKTTLCVVSACCEVVLNGGGCKTINMHSGMPQAKVLLTTCARIQE